MQTDFDRSEVVFGDTVHEFVAYAPAVRWEWTSGSTIRVWTDNDAIDVCVTNLNHPTLGEMKIVRDVTNYSEGGRMRAVRMRYLTNDVFTFACPEHSLPGA